MNEIDLKSIIKQHPDCVTNGAKLKAILLDTYPMVSKGLINVICVISTCGIASEIVKRTNVDKLQKDVWSQKLSDDYCFNKQISDECLALWCNSINSINKETLDKKLYNDAINYIKKADETKLDDEAVENYINALNCFEKIKHGSIIYKNRIGNLITKLYIRAKFEISPQHYFMAMAKCAGYNYKQSATLLGHCFKYGIGTEFNITKAIESYRLSRFEDIDAIIELGDCLQYGLGIKQSFDYAIHEYKKAETLGSTEASNLISDIENIRKYRYPDKYVLSDDEQNDNGFIFIGNKLNRYIGNETIVTIPSYITTISSWAFAGCVSIEKVIIGQSVESIGTAAFYGCTNLQEVALLSSEIKKIPRKLFFACSQLKEIKLPHSVESIGVSAFEGCSSLNTISIPNSVKSIASKCFMRCSNLQKVVLPYTLTEFGFGTFFLCPSLKVIEYNGDEFLWNRIKGARYIHNNNEKGNYGFTQPSLISDNINCKLIFKNELPSEVKAQVELLKKPIEELGLKKQTYVSLKRANIHTINDIVSKSKSILLTINCFGECRLNEVVEALGKYNLSLPD